MSKVDLKGNPFYLNEDQIKWVEETKAGMTIEEKIGQLFFLMGFTTKEKELIDVVNTIRPGGMMYRTAKAKKVTSAHRVLQHYSKVPMLLAANLEAGGNGLIEEGTAFGNNMMIAATDNTESAYRLGKVCGDEAATVGGNMAFAPVIDINYNWRNPITNIRSFGDDPKRVAEMGAAYVKGAHAANCSVTIKHFPGDGVDGRDQHLLTTHNTLEYSKWMDTFGYAYKTSIEAGARGLMVGHITLPKYMEEKYPEAKAYVTMPATLNPYLLNNLLREELGYNGLTMTDASLMTGFGQKGRRKDLVPLSIAAGCDMFLFTRQPKDDYNHMMNGYKNGVITDERLDEALTRILAIKASLKLNGKTAEELVPGTFEQANLNQHDAWAKEVADQAITLVKDEQNMLPLDPKVSKRIGVIYSGNPDMKKVIFDNLPGFKGKMFKFMMSLNKEKSAVEKFVDALNKQGFEAFEYDFGNILSVLNDMTGKTLDEWKSQFDAIIYMTKVETASNQTSLQVNYKAMGFDAPWWIEDIPTMLVSVGNPYQQYDFEMVKTVINGYMPGENTYEAIAEKIVGKSEFKGTSPVKLTFEEINGFQKYM
jgi:beta-N-acetylhexosaminidase